MATFTIVIAAFEPRLQGEISAGLQGFKVHLVEKVTEKGVKAGLSTEELANAVNLALNQSETITRDTAFINPRTWARQKVGAEPEKSRDCTLTVGNDLRAVWNVEAAAEKIIQASAHGGSHSSGQAHAYIVGERNEKDD